MANGSPDIERPLGRLASGICDLPNGIMGARSGKLLAAGRLLFAALALTAVAWQLVHGLDRPTFSAANFFSFFTIESNLLAAGVLIAAGVAGLRNRDGGGLRGGGNTGPLPVGRSEGLDLLRGAVTLYMASTGLVYAVLLAGVDSANDPLLPWVNTVLHDVMPLAVLADWLIDPPRRRIAFRRVVLWLLFPLAFITYTLVRGHFADWYPYPFVDVAEHGYLEVAITSLVIGAAMLAFGWLLAWVAALRSRSA
jgi:hypothetical protein